MAHTKQFNSNCPVQFPVSNACTVLYLECGTNAVGYCTFEIVVELHCWSVLLYSVFQAATIRRKVTLQLKRVHTVWCIN